MKNLIKSMTLVPIFLLAACGCPDGCTTHKHSHGTAQAAEKKQVDAVVVIDSQEAFTNTVNNAKKPVIVDFSASWCGACQVLKPVFHELADELSNDYLFAIVDVDKVKEVAESFGIKGIPALLFFKDGKEVEDARHAGAMTKSELKTMIEKAFGK